jgi:uncharacterized protein (UPF0179 family)
VGHVVVITLVGELQARKGDTFVYCGPLSECRECKLKTVCFNLDVGRWYKVSSVREKHHECKVHEKGVRVVEAEQIGIPASVPARSAVEGTTISFEPRQCSSFYCENYRLCHPTGVVGGAKYQVSEVVGDLECADGRPLKRVTLN